MTGLAALLFSEFFKTKISQGNEATWFRCGGIFNSHFIENLLLNVSVKKLFKNRSVNSYMEDGQSGCFMTHSLTL